MRDTNRPAEAEVALRGSLEIHHRQTLHLERVAVLNNLAKLHRMNGNEMEAGILLSQALEAAQQLFGAEHPDVSERLIDLAAHFSRMNRPREAGLCFRRALQIDEKALGADHEQTANTLTHLAELLRERWCASRRAEQLGRRALAVHEQVHGATHPQLARDLNNLAVLLQATDRIPEALDYMRRALAITETADADNEMKVASARNNLAMMLQQLNRLDEAEPCCGWRSLRLSANWGHGILIWPTA